MNGTLTLADTVKVQRAVLAAQQCYPGVVGEFLADQLDAYVRLGHRFERGGRMSRLIDALIEQGS